MIKIQFDYQMFDAQLYGGISRYFANLISGLRSEPGYSAEVSVLFTENYYLKDKYVLDNKIGRTIFSDRKRIPKWNKNYSRYCIARSKFDIFHPTYFHPYFLKLLKKPFVITVHDMIYELYPNYFDTNDLTPQNKKLLIKAAAHIIAISETTKRDLMQILGVPEEKITVVYHGHTAIRNHRRPDITLPEQYLLFVGGRDKYKNFDKFIHGAAIVMKSYPGMSLICAGGGAFTEEESNRLQELGISDKTIHYDVTDDFLYWLYKEAKAFIYPSLYEGFGLPILEAFEAGCPVILSNTSSFTEVAGEGAFYFEPESYENIAESIIYVIENDALRQQMVQNGAIRLKAFTMEKCVAQTIAVYNKCLGN